MALALERRGMARERLERRSVDKELVHEIEASTAEAKKSKWEARAAEAKARMFNAEAVRSYEIQRISAIQSSDNLLLSAAPVTPPL